MDLGSVERVPIPLVDAPAHDEATRNLRLAYLDFSARDQTLLHDLERLFETHLQEIVDKFYAHLTSFEHTRKIFRDEGMIQRLKGAQKAYLIQAVRGPYDAAYFERRWRIGYIHNVIELDPQWFIGAYQLYRRILYPLIMAQYSEDTPAALEHMLALDKILTLDQTVALESYWVHYNAAMEQLHAMNVRIRAASAAKSQFLANMSHEFRTPLNAILGFTEVLQDQIAGPLNEEQIEFLRDIHKGGEVLLRLINDVLDLAKIEAGRLDLFYETFSIAQAVRESVATLRGEAQKRQLTLKTDLPPDLGMISADQIRFKQILFNLLSNAVKFTEAGEVTVTGRIEDGQFHLAVRDTGIGIRAEDRPKIFVEFSQVNSGHAKQHEGTGLGLALTKRLVGAHGGRIWFDSEPGKGSTFHVLLPLAAPPAHRTTRAEPAEEAHHAER